MCNVQQAEVAPRPGPLVCRSLFGPVDRAELRRELHSRLREMEEESSRRWDFDFHRGVPLPSSRYVWEENGEDSVPAFYRAPHRVRSTNRTLHGPGDTQTEPNASLWSQPATSDSTQPAPNASQWCQATPNDTLWSQPATSASNSTQPAPNASQWCQATLNASLWSQPATSTSNSTQPAPNASQWCQATPNASLWSQPATSNSTQPAPNASLWHQPATSASKSTQPAPNANQWCQATPTAQPAHNTSHWCQPTPSANNSTQPAPSASTELTNSTQPTTIVQPAPSASTEPNRTQPALSASSGPCKRSHPVSHITGFFPVKKKSKVVKALCDKLHSRSPILTEHTPRKMLR